MEAPTPMLLMMQGLPASGKTTYAKKLVEQGNWLRVNKDDLRLMMDNSVHSKSNENRVIRIRNTIIMDALANGKNVVVDDTNFAPIHATNLADLANKLNADFKITFIDTPLEDCLLRNAGREKQVPEQVIQHMYNQYLKPPEQETTDNEELEEAIIVDVDGTLAHITGNSPRNPYDASRAMEDSLDDAVSNVVAMAYQNGYKVIILTGRHSGHLKVTQDWLKANGINYDHIYCRAEGDNRKDYIVKEELYREHIEGKFKVKYVIDDRPNVCRMWRQIGLFTFQVGDPDVDF